MLQGAVCAEEPAWLSRLELYALAHKHDASTPAPHCRPLRGCPRTLPKCVSACLLMSDTLQRNLPYRKHKNVRLHNGSSQTRVPHLEEAWGCQQLWLQRLSWAGIQGPKRHHADSLGCCCCVYPKALNVSPVCSQNRDIAGTGSSFHHTDRQLSLAGYKADLLGARI